MQKQEIWKTAVLVTVSSLLLLAACQPASTPTPISDYLSTSVAATLQAQATLDAAVSLSIQMTAAAQPTATFTPQPTLPPPPTATLPILPTQAPAAVIQPAQPVQPVAPAAPTATKVPVNLCLHAKLSSDSPLDVVRPDTDFTKKWQFQNIGTCPWDSEFDLRWVSGDDFGIKVIDLPFYVEPGDFIDVSQVFDGFTKPGVYKSNWMIFSSDGRSFGIGNNAASAVVITVEVKE